MPKIVHPQDFDAWFTRAQPKLLRLAQSRLRQRAEAEDVVQETALALWRLVLQGGIEDLDAYAARAVWQNSLRRLSRRKQHASLDEPEAQEPAAPGPAVDALDAMELERAIAELPLTQQTVLRLRFYAGFSFQETADALSIGLNTAASRCRYALTALRLAFDPQHSKEEQDVSPRTASERAELRQRGKRGSRRRP